MIEIRLAKSGQAIAVQAVYMSKTVIRELGEFVHLQGIKNKVRTNKDRGSVWIATLDGEMVGAANVGSRRNYSHLLRHGEIGIYGENRRQRIGTALYLAQIAQAAIEGRRQCEDTIISDNPNMFSFLPTIGYTCDGVLYERTTAFKDIHLFRGNTAEVFDVALDRLFDIDFIIEVNETPSTRKTCTKNFETYKKRDREEITDSLAKIRDRIWNDSRFRLVVTADAATTIETSLQKELF